MLIILNFLKAYWFRILIVGAVIGAGWWTYNHIRQVGYDDANSTWQKKWDDQAKQLAEDRAKAEKDQRDKEQLWQSKINQVQNDAEQKINDLETDLVAANSSAISLREQARRLAERAGKTCNSSSTGTGGTSTETTEMVLAELLTRVDERAGELAEAYDRARVAGLACERSYDSLRD